MRLRAHLELISFCIALRILYAGLEECCWCHLPRKHSWSAAWRQQISETESHSWYFSHSHVRFSGNWYCLTERKFVWKQRHRSVPAGRRDSCPKAGCPSESAGTAMHWLPHTQTRHGRLGLPAPAHCPWHKNNEPFSRRHHGNVSLPEQDKGTNKAQGTIDWEQLEGEEWWSQFRGKERKGFDWNYVTPSPAYCFESQAGNLSRKWW